MLTLFCSLYHTCVITCIRTYVCNYIRVHYFCNFLHIYNCNFIVLSPWNRNYHCNYDYQMLSYFAHYHRYRAHECKAYTYCLFACALIRAIHLELTIELSASSFCWHLGIFGTKSLPTVVMLKHLSTVPRR